MTDDQLNALAQKALRDAEKAKKRSQEYRDRKKSKGMTQLSIWVPTAYADVFKKAFENHVRSHPTGNRTETTTTHKPPA